MMADLFGSPRQVYGAPDGVDYYVDADGMVYSFDVNFNKVYGVTDSEALNALFSQGCLDKAVIQRAIGVVGNPDGGYQGPGTINAEGLYVNGVDVTASDIEGTASTVNGADQVVIAGITPPPNTMNALECTFVGRQSDSSNALLIRAVASFLADSQGAVMQVGTTFVEETQATAGASSWSVGISTDGTSVVLTATGADGTTVLWNAWGNLTSV